MHSAPRELYNSFVRLRGFLVTLIAIPFTVVAFYAEPHFAVAIKWIVPVLLLLIFAIMILIDFAIRAHGAANRFLPSVISTIEEPYAGKAESVILLMEPSDLFGQGVMVSIYQIEDGFEILIALGYVKNIQEDQKIQVIAQPLEGKGEAWERICKDVGRYRESILVKPSTQYDHLYGRIA